MQTEFRTYKVAAHTRQPLIDFVAEGFAAAGCRIVHLPEADVAPFRFVIDTPWRERIGVVMYLFRSTSVATRNRPQDKSRFQVKYGPETGELHPIFDDPHGLYVTLFAGIDLERGVMVAADPRVHDPTRFFISIEYKIDQALQTLRAGWTSWERSKIGHAEPIETLVACAQDRILDLVLFERAAHGLAPGHRQLLAEKVAERSPSMALVDYQSSADPLRHELLAELNLDMSVLLEIIQNAARLKMAVRGWVAEHHLIRALRSESVVGDAVTIPGDGQPDVAVTLTLGRKVRVECKNCLRMTTRGGLPRVDFQRTRAAKGDPCSRYYLPAEFEILAACLHPVTEKWEFAYKLTTSMKAHRKCEGRLDDRVVIDDTWVRSFAQVIGSLP